ncbi:MAG: hypothetical protein II784_01325 [Oscillospiraceae bacterium]|nr:hypothetical protein [Oscillospiraceae bacterium]MBR6428276.1 hypothetical protein [Clostridia bacterium]
MSCPYYWWNNHYACRKSGKDVNEDIYYKYCRGYDYGDCPIYKGKDSSSSGWCFLTSACVEERGLADDCRELTAMRALRDNYIRNIPGGEDEIREYYETAPLIVSAIKASDDRKSEFDSIYREMILPCLEFVESGKYHDAYTLYKSWVSALKHRYI